MTQLMLSTENKMSFTCPIFDAPTQVRACVQLRHKVYKGERPEVRRGCQAVMHCGKCPMASMIQRICMKSANASDDLVSDTVATGKLPADILEHILPIMVIESALSGYRVSDAERSLIESSNLRIEKQLETAPNRSRPKVKANAGSTPRGRSSIKVEAPKEVKETAINIAAATGDMSAALNQVGT